MPGRLASQRHSDGSRSTSLPPPMIDSPMSFFPRYSNFLRDTRATNTTPSSRGAYRIPAAISGLLASFRLLNEHSYVPTTDRKPETILAFDFGLRRIGIAVGQSVTSSASPLGVVTNSEDGPDFDAISRLIDEWRPARLIVGLPMHSDGEPGEMQAHVEEFVRDLWRYNLKVDTVDERYTSLEAEEALKNARASGTRCSFS